MQQPEDDADSRDGDPRPVAADEELQRKSPERDFFPRRAAEKQSQGEERGSPSQAFAGYRLEMREACQQRECNQKRRAAHADRDSRQQIASGASPPMQSQIGKSTRFENRH